MAITSVSPAFAQASLTDTTPGFTYFHKPGATIESHDAEVTECRAHAKRFWQPFPSNLQAPYGTDPLSGTLGTTIAGAIIQGVESAKARPINIENCMVARGWAVVRLPRAEDAELETLDKPSRRARLKALVEAEAPHGEIARVFRNDVLYGATVFAQAGRYDKRSLSMAAFDDGEDEKEEPTRRGKATSSSTDRRPVQFSLDGIPAIPAGKAVIIIRVVSPTNGRSISFTRVGRDQWTAASIDGQVDVIRTRFPRPRRKETPPTEAVVAFVLPAGRWAIDSMGPDNSYDSGAVRFCHGAPAFDLAAGEVLFAGSFDARSIRGLVPELDLTPLSQDLVSRPDIAAMVRPASYRNGALIPCFGEGYGYALEIPGATFFEGYRYGGVARPYVAESIENFLAGRLRRAIAGGSVVHRAEPEPSSAADPSEADPSTAAEAGVGPDATANGPPPTASKRSRRRR